MLTDIVHLARDSSSGYLLRQALEGRLYECRSPSMCQCVPLYLCYQPPLSFVSVLCRPTVVFSSSGDRANARFYVFHAISRTLIHLSVFCACTPTCPHDPHPTRIPLNARSREAEELSRVAGDEIWKISEASMDARSRDRMMSARTGKTSGVQTSFASLSDDSACSAGLELPERGWSRIVRADVVAGSGRYGEAARVFLEVMGHRRVQVGG